MLRLSNVLVPARLNSSPTTYMHLEVARDPFRSGPRHPSMAVFGKCLRSPRRRCRASEACLPTLLSMMRVGVSAFVSPSSWHLLSGCWGLLTDKIYPLCSAEPSHELAFLIRDSHMLPFHGPPCMRAANACLIPGDASYKCNPGTTTL